MKILNRYILKDFIKSFIISMFVIYSLLLIQLMIKLLDKFLGKGFSFSFLGELLFYNTAWILATTIPMAVLVSSILVYGKLSSNNEIIGFKASGINTIKIIKPALVTSIFICLATIYFSCNILPKMNFKARKLNHELAQKRPDVEFEESIYSDIIPNHLIKFEKRDKQNKSKFYGIIIHQISNNKLKRSIISDSVIINSDEKNVVFDLYHGAIHERVELNEEYRQIDFQNYKLNVSINNKNNRNIKYIRGDRELTFNMLMYANDSLREKIDYYKNKINKRLLLFDLDTLYLSDYQNLIKVIEEINKDSINKIEDIAEQKIYDRKTKANKTIISGYLNNINRSSNKINKNTVEIHKKFALPIASIIFVLIGAPLGIRLRGGNIGMSMAISLMFFILYYILIVGSEQLADKNQLNPILSMWLPNIIVLIFGGIWIFNSKNN